LSISQDRQVAQHHEQAIQEAKPALQKPKLYRVLLLNDDYTPMEFVIDVLRQVFFKGYDEAVQLMMSVHQSGQAVCGVYPLEIAEMKVSQVQDLAAESKHPLKSILESE